MNNLQTNGHAGNGVLADAGVATGCPDWCQWRHRGFEHTTHQNHPVDIPLTLEQPNTLLNWVTSPSPHHAGTGQPYYPPAAKRIGELGALRREAQQLVARVDRLAAGLGAQPDAIPSWLTVDLAEDKDGSKISLWRLFDEEDEEDYFGSTRVNLSPDEARCLAEALLQAVGQAEQAVIGGDSR